MTDTATAPSADATAGALAALYAEGDSSSWVTTSALAAKLGISTRDARHAARRLAHAGRAENTKGDRQELLYRPVQPAEPVLWNGGPGNARDKARAAALGLAARQAASARAEALNGDGSTPAAAWKQALDETGQPEPLPEAGDHASEAALQAALDAGVTAELTDEARAALEADQAAEASQADAGQEG